MKIIAVDDDVIFLRLLALALKKLGYTDFTLVDSADKALKTIDQAAARYDCFLLDVNMPGMNGIELCGAIRKRPHYANTPILMLTGLSDQEHMSAAFQAGATDYTTKPIDELELSTRLKLASEFHTKNQRIDLLNAEVEANQADAGMGERLRLSSRFALDDVLGAIEYLAFENFLYRTSVEAHNIEVFAVMVRNADDFFHACNSSDFQYVMNSVGDIIGDALKSRRFFLTYAGDGIFAIALTDGQGLDLETFSANLFFESSDLEITGSNGKSLLPDLVIGAPTKTNFLPWKANVNTLSEAISNVEQAARELDAAASPLLSAKPRKWSPLQRLLKAS